MAFKRAFGRGHEDLKRFAETTWGRDLLSLWRPAGQPTRDDLGLRLAVRNGTLNFYRRGRAVAKVGFCQNKEPWLEVHVAYVTGQRGLGQHYARLSSTELRCKSYSGSLRPYDGRQTLATWIENADNHKGSEKGGEKEFVDELVTHNPQVIDLEMALPGYKSKKTGKLIAPRMDLVTLEDAPVGVQIVFWEAKMMGNGELRCKPGTENGKEKKPHVVGQLKKYTKWLGEGSNEADVIKAYQVNCSLLLKLHALARVINPEIGELSRMIRAAEEQALTVDHCPRIIVRDPHDNKSWTENEYDLVLKKEGIPVQLISGKPPASYALQPRP